MTTQIFQILRHVSGQRVTADDTPLDLDSLARVDLLCRLESDLGVPMPDDLPECSTAGEVVAWVEGQCTTPQAA